jgi:predicted amidophosphoribosyltransferase
MSTCSAIPDSVVSSYGPLRSMWNALLQPDCLACGLRAGPVCDACAAAIADCEVEVQRRDGLLRAWAAPHEPPASRMVVALKESGARALTPLLSAVLARPLAQVLLDQPGQSGAVTLMPIPQRPRNRLRRPQDPVVQLTLGAAALLGAVGLPVQVSPSLQWVRGGPDQSRLTAADRRGNVHGALRAIAPSGSGRAVLVDDVVTTGSTALEAARAASAVGWNVAAVASITHPCEPVSRPRGCEPGRLASRDHGRVSRAVGLD